jgi:hypothetical protein
VWPKLVVVLWPIGAARILWWARRERRWLAAALVLGAPFALLLAVIASSGSWQFHNYRYIAAAFPLLLVPVAIALAPARLPSRVWLARAWTAAAVVVVALFVRAATRGLVDNAKFYAQNAADVNAQVVTLGHYVHAKLPDASIMFHDAGAVAYYGDTRVYDMLGLITNGQAGVASNGPGSRFEFLEDLPVDERPTHFVYYPSWMGQSEFFGESIMHTTIARTIYPKRLVGGPDMQIIEANFDHVHTAERPLAPHAGWRIADRVDVADLASERAHAWSADLGRRTTDIPTAHWSFFHKQTSPTLLLDGGRTILGDERFTLDVDPTKPVRLVLRTGGAVRYDWQDPITRTVTVRILDGDRELARTSIPPPTGPMFELPFDLPAGIRPLHVASDGPYRAMHWFALQPE